MTVCCSWCGQAFEPRTSGGSCQRFCKAACRQAFWSAARSWVALAFQTGLLSTDVLKAAQASVHAGLEPFRTVEGAEHDACSGSPRM
jgi:hypothetical protein